MDQKEKAIQRAEAIHEQEITEAVRSIQQQIETARKDFTQAGATEPMAMAVAAILGGRVVACNHKIKKLQEDVSTLIEILEEAER